VGRGIGLQGLEGNFGRCGAISERFGVVHTCYAQQYRFCQPLAKSPVLSVPGWYRCVDSLATKLLLTPELKTTAALAQVSGQIDALQTPRRRSRCSHPPTSGGSARWADWSPCGSERKRRKLQTRYPPCCTRTPSEEPSLCVISTTATYRTRWRLASR
jgi:hypothetical protein